jgi:hypothetical protein
VSGAVAAVRTVVAPGQNGAVTAAPAPEVLAPARWRALAEEYADRIDALTAAHRRRSQAQLAHPVEDFLFTYYTLRPAQLRRWHPGAGVALADAGDRADWAFYRVDGDGTATVDLPAFLARRSVMLRLVKRLVSHTAAAPAQFGCFGLHEWAMVYRQTTPDLRHPWPLRLGPAGTDQVVESHQIRCSHHDAFRFFTPAARPRNLLSPSAQTRDSMDQPGCLHAGMDLYKWCYKLSPVMPADLLLDCFLLARDIRELDMRASPYDLGALGYPPVAIETAAGKAEYVAAQRGFADRGQELRGRLLAVLPDPDAAG